MTEAALRDIAYVNRVDVTVSSAGARATDGREADPETAKVACKFGLPLDTHRSRRLTAEIVAAHDLILCAEAEHLFAVIDLVPEAFSRSFLLLQMAEGALDRKGDESLPDWVARHHAGRTPQGVMASAAEFNLGDPYRMGRKRITEALFRIMEASRKIVGALAPN